MCPVGSTQLPGSFQGPLAAPLCLRHPHSRPRQAHAVDKGDERPRCRARPQERPVGAATQENQITESGNLIQENELLMIWGFEND